MINKGSIVPTNQNIKIPTFTIHYVTSQASTSNHYRNISTFNDLFLLSLEDVERTAMEYIYLSLSQKRKIAYELPSLHCFAATNINYQRIRLPERVFYSGAMGKEGKGTCIDIALLIAGCLESIGLNPIIILLGDGEDAPRHVLAGCYIGSAPGGRPIVTSKERIIEEIKRGHIFLQLSISLLK